ncbi:hypothetical protein JW935_24670 [candidate division KSB1 bacterium]|nr:hypothetical protein [candidate division KSB1 bacterium]
MDTPKSQTGRLISSRCPNESCIFIVEEKVSGYFLIRSVNDGKNWTREPLPQLTSDDAGALFFLNSKFGYWGRYKTENGGISWTIQENIILHTNNAGNSWQVQLKDETIWLSDLAL